MILFVFEGRKTEPSLFKTLEYLYFNNPLEKYVLPGNEVSILNAFPLFLYEYFK